MKIVLADEVVLCSGAKGTVRGVALLVTNDAFGRVVRNRQRDVAQRIQDARHCSSSSFARARWVGLIKDYGMRNAARIVSKAADTQPR